ncbi:hypothetical protein WR25_07066, partial [Diploscapter pachys]
SCKLNSTITNITCDYHHTINYNYNSSLQQFSLTFVPVDGCLVYMSIEFENAEMEILAQDHIVMDENITTDYSVAVPALTNRMDISPRPLPFTILLKDSHNYTINSNVLLSISTDKVGSNTQNSSVVQLAPGTGQLYDLAQTPANTTMTFSVANGNPNSRLLAFLSCDDSRVAPFQYDFDNSRSDFCCRIMFFDKDNDYKGCLMNLLNANKDPNKGLHFPIIGYKVPLTSLTVYQAYYPQLFAQIYFHVPQIDIDLISQYSVATNSFSSYLEVMDRWGEAYTADIIPYAVEIRFVKLEENNRKCLSYVNMNRTAKLLVYEGFAEIKGYDLPKANLIATITENGKVNNVELTSPLYTFVAIEGDVYYEITDDGIYLNSKISADRNLMIILNPIGGCIIYLTVEYDNANVKIDMAENIIYDLNKTVTASETLPSTMKRIEIPPRPMFMTVSLRDTKNYDRNSTVSLIITTDRVNTSAPEIKLNVGEGYLYDATKIMTNTTTKVSLATANSSNSRLLLFFHCDESRVVKNHDDPNSYCCSILFYRENGYQGCLRIFEANARNEYLPMDPVTSFTVYQKYIPQMFAQIYFYAPQIDFRYFLYNYGLALPNDLIFNIVFDRYNTVFSLARFLATVHFVNFQGTNQKRLSYVQLNRDATLLVYKGIPEIVGYDFPNKDLVAKIT